MDMVVPAGHLNIIHSSSQAAFWYVRSVPDSKAKLSAMTGEMIQKRLQKTFLEQDGVIMSNIYYPIQLDQKLIPSCGSITYTSGEPSQTNGTEPTNFSFNVTINMSTSFIIISIKLFH